jgi:hypothetical protein
MNTIIKFVLSKWFFLVGIIAAILFIMPLNSPLHLPGDFKPVVAVISLIIIFEMFFVKHDPKPIIKCRMCGATGKMAITYETDGLCRKCFDEVIPLATRQPPKDADGNYKP